MSLIKKVIQRVPVRTVYFLDFQSVNIKEIKDYNNKNKKSIENFVSRTAEYFNEIRSSRVLPYGKKRRKPTGICIRMVNSGQDELTGDGKNFVRSWTFCFSEGNIKSTGKYKDFKREGVWTFYYYSGRLKAREYYKNGKLDGNQLYYSERGLITYDENYLNDQKNGLLTEYYINGNVYSLANYTAGKIDGEYKNSIPVDSSSWLSIFERYSIRRICYLLSQSPDQRIGNLFKWETGRAI
jgi:antitoxin component YwqK of YwqJK toxin-antitoxin module